MIFNYLLSRPNAFFRAFPLCLLLFLAACGENPYRDGEALYKGNCASCHMENGAGLGALIPPLAGSDFLSARRERLPCIVRYGLTDSITVNGVGYAEQMAGIEALSDIDITNLLNYVNQTWGNNHPPFKLEEVRELLKKCKLKEAWGVEGLN